MPFIQPQQRQYPFRPTPKVTYAPGQEDIQKKFQWGQARHKEMFGGAYGAFPTGAERISALRSRTAPIARGASLAQRGLRESAARRGFVGGVPGAQAQIRMARGTAMGEAEAAEQQWYDQFKRDAQYKALAGMMAAPPPITYMAGEDQDPYGAGGAFDPNRYPFRGTYPFVGPSQSRNFPTAVAPRTFMGGGMAW